MQSYRLQEVTLNPKSFQPKTQSSHIIQIMFIEIDSIDIIALRYDFKILPSKILYLTKAIESENDILFSKVSLI